MDDQPNFTAPRDWDEELGCEGEESMKKKHLDLTKRPMGYVLAFLLLLLLPLIVFFGYDTSSIVDGSKFSKRVKIIYFALFLIISVLWLVSLNMR